jgi:hypothetical protein
MEGPSAVGATLGGTLGGTSGGVGGPGGLLGLPESGYSSGVGECVGVSNMLDPPPSDEELSSEGGKSINDAGLSDDSVASDDGVLGSGGEPLLVGEPSVVGVPLLVDESDDGGS